MSEGDGSDNGMWRSIVNTCHVWDEHGQAVADCEAGAPVTIPVFLRGRLNSSHCRPRADRAAAHRGWRLVVHFCSMTVEAYS